MNGTYVGKKESKVACRLRSKAIAHSGQGTKPKAQSQKNQGSKEMSYYVEFRGAYLPTRKLYVL